MNCPHCINRILSLLLTGPATLSAGVNSVLLILRTFGRLDPPTPFVLGFPIPFREKKKQNRYKYLISTCWPMYEISVHLNQISVLMNQILVQMNQDFVLMNQAFS